eukprot:6098975-Prorocentrum_lima.AAC.1
MRIIAIGSPQARLAKVPQNSGGLWRGFGTDTDHRAWVAAGAACYGTFKSTPAHLGTSTPEH